VRAAHAVVILPAMRTHRALTVTLLAALAVLPFAAAQTVAPAASGDAAEARGSGMVGADPLRADRVPLAHGDPRVCLEYATNLEVIACAEKYRPHRRKS